VQDGSRGGDAAAQVHLMQDAQPPSIQIHSYPAGCVSRAAPTRGARLEPPRAFGANRAVAGEFFAQALIM
ncbi:MAG TPA: hypothetical protein VKB37_07370, partial [Jatrophihabitantaceae bacterium]|nr:hypothetical protein [Jatrophihabitantaceae bacterium]